MNPLLAGRLLLAVGKRVYSNPHARETITKMVGREALRQVATPKEAAKNLTLIGLKVGSIASTGHTARQYSAESARIRGDAGAKPAKPWQGKTADKAAMGAYGLTFAAFLVRPTKLVYGAGLAGGILTAGALGRNSARMKAAAAKTERNGATTEGGRDKHKPGGGAVRVKEHQRVTARGTIQTVRAHERHGFG